MNARLQVRVMRPRPAPESPAMALLGLVVVLATIAAYAVVFALAVYGVVP